MPTRSILRAGFLLALAAAIVGAPGRQLTDLPSAGGDSLRVAAAHTVAALVGNTNGTPDADLRPGDERDPAAPLPGSAAGALLLAGAVAVAFLLLCGVGRPARTQASGPHDPRAPPLSVTV
ncbi:MAG: hypothetical protein ACJ758_11285 [Actinomycetota bacterium]